MIDFSLTEEQRSLQETVRRFALQEIRPVAHTIDRHHDPEKNFPWEIVKKGMQLGFGNVVIPEQYGGLGGGLIDYALVVEELGYGDAGIADVFLVNISLSRLLVLGCSDEQKEKWLPQICSDESGTFILAGGMTEPSGGSEIFCPLPDPAMGVRTSAVRCGDEYVLNGRKCFITNGGVSRLYIVLARTSKSLPNMQGCSIFLVPDDTPGLSFGKLEEKMGHRLSSVREVIFEDVRIPASYLVGQEGEGFRILLQCYEGNGVGVGSNALGLARAAYDAALEYAQERIIWGQQISEYESVASKLVDMRMKIEAGRALVWKLAWAAENMDRCSGLHRLGTIAKVFPSSFVREITIGAMDILGGSGYTMEFPVEKYVRDAMLFPIYDGTNDLLKRFVAPQLPEVPSTAI
ncbi:MAG TPA: acyl-CoA dehydrogenase family protein [Thermodesulfobacteriota bacterium]|nr:acyl-CoA dehydrogenase family protein [Thermodesulfobacteriota bacterium]